MQECRLNKQVAGSTGKCKISDLFEKLGFRIWKAEPFRGLRFGEGSTKLSNQRENTQDIVSALH